MIFVKNKDRNYKISSKEYQKIKIRQSEYISKQMKGKLIGDRNGMYGKTHSIESRLKIKRTRELRGLNVISDEIKCKMSKSHIGKSLSKEHCLNLSLKQIGDKNHMYGRKGNKHHLFGKESKIKGIKYNRNKIECPNCGRIGGSSNMKRYHFENCKLKKENIMKNFEIIKKIIDLNQEEILSIDGWGTKKCSLLLNKFNKVKTNEFPLALLLSATDSFNGKLGQKSCQTILNNIDEFDLINIRNGANLVDKLCKINGVSKLIANVFQNGIIYYFKYESILDLNYFIKTPQKEQSSNKYEGFSICMSGFRDKELQDKIESNGGKMVSGVSKNTTHLLVKDKSSTSSKMKKAEGLGIVILTKEEFLNL